MISALSLLTMAFNFASHKYGTEKQPVYLFGTNKKILGKIADVDVVVLLVLVCSLETERRSHYYIGGSMTGQEHP